MIYIFRCNTKYIFIYIHILMSIDISPKNVSGKCDLKCAYVFNYPESNLTAKNNGVVINLTPDESNVPPVLYNNEKYKVSKINIYSPSIHLFLGNKTQAELVVEHIPILGGNTLYVCVPIIQSSDTNTATTLLTEIIETVGKAAPSESDSVNINLAHFTLENIIPIKPFYSYTSNDTSSGKGGDYIVFGKPSSIPLTETTISILGKIISPFPIVTPGGKIFYNGNGPNSSGDISNQGIYISCQPTGSSEEEINVTYMKSEPVNDIMTIINDPVTRAIINYILGSIIIIFIFYVFYKFLEYLNNPNDSNMFGGNR